MQFIVLAYDGTDEGAFERRLAVRETHLKFALDQYNSGHWLFASALLNDDGKMIGSMIVCEYGSREELQDRWLQNEPYILSKVWHTIDIRRAQVAPFCLKK